MPDTPNPAPEDLLTWLHQNADTVRQLLRQSPDTYHKRWLDKRRQQGKCYRCGDPLGACKHKACDTCRAKTRQQHHNRQSLRP